MTGGFPKRKVDFRTPPVDVHDCSKEVWNPVGGICRSCGRQRDLGVIASASQGSLQLPKLAETRSNEGICGFEGNTHIVFSSGVPLKTHPNGVPLPSRTKTMMIQREMLPHIGMPSPTSHPATAKRLSASGLLGSQRATSMSWKRTFRWTHPWKTPLLAPETRRKPLSTYVGNTDVG